MHPSEVKACEGAMKPMPENLHRNNAAEWILWAVLLPAVPIVWLIERMRARKQQQGGNDHG